MKTSIVDSFTNVPFKGNPAGVCQVDRELTDEVMLLIAQELGLSETVFVRPVDADRFSVRFFSPKMEIPLCGHATLAAAKVVFSDSAPTEICFLTQQGLILRVSRRGDWLRMEFPANKLNLPMRLHNCLPHSGWIRFSHLRLISRRRS